MDASSPADGAVQAVPAQTLTVRLTAIRWLAEDIHGFEFRRPDGGPLPPFTAGAHVDVHLPGGLVRPYSLCNPPHETHRYEVAVKRDAAGRGGSRAMHDQLRVGELLTLDGPRNHFALDESAGRSVLIAGGIGITPIACMAQRLQALGASFEVHYSVRRREDAALLDALPSDRLRLHVDAEHGGAPLPVAALVADAPPAAHLYCCGPAPMLDAFEAATRGRPPTQVHLERFSAPATQAATGGGYAVELARSRRTLRIPPGATILEVLRREGLTVAASCEQGICGSCETRVLAGRPDHRDHLLSDEEKQAGNVMMVCCSGSHDPVLVLDL